MRRRRRRGGSGPDRLLNETLDPPAFSTASLDGRDARADTVHNAHLLVGSHVLTRRPNRIITEPPPLLLLPLRLEYRVVARGARTEIVDRREERSALVGATRSTERHGDRDSASDRARLDSARAVRASPFRTRPLRIDAKKEIWFRWYPDENFSERGVAPPTADEIALRTEMLTKLAGKPWWNMDDPPTADAWQAFASATGPDRALHLLRSASDSASHGDERRGRIAALPDNVQLFAINGEDVSSLGAGAALPTNESGAPSSVTYVPEAMGGDGWLTNFDLAVELGMGLRISDPKLVKSALRADWIVAVGMSSTVATDEVEALLRDRIANGEFEFLAQDTPTNNSPDTDQRDLAGRKDPRAFMARSAQLENGALAAAPAEHNASLFCEALDIDAGTAKRVPNSAGTDFVDAQAMLRVIGPAIFDGALDGSTLLDDVDENEFIDVLATGFVARGALPAFRSGHNSYGLAVITDVAEVDPAAGPNKAENAVRQFLARYAAAARQLLPARSEAITPVLRPDDEAASDKFAEILRSDRVSARLDVSDVGSSETAPIACPYVDGAADAHKPAAYLQALRTTPLSSLPDPDATNRNWPLLYRLARLSLTRNTVLLASGYNEGVRPSLRRYMRSGITRRSAPRAGAPREPFSSDELDESDATTMTGVIRTFSVDSIRGSRITPAGLGAALFERMQRITQRFAHALEQLERVAARPNGVVELEILLLETIDFLQHRVDAWATGLAYERLRESRRAGRSGLMGGYYGFLGKLREDSRSGIGDGYIQAPSTQQATAAAIMRSAYRRHRQNGAFNINLRSGRVRRALDIIDLLQRGLSLNESLGIRGERWLRDHDKSALIAKMRDAFPLKTVNAAGEVGADSERVERRMFDGLAAIAASGAGGTAAEEQTFARLRQALSDDLDTVADVIMAEAVYQRSLGAAGPANAWLQVLSGGALPGQPQFLRTARQSQGSTYRISRLLEAEEPTPGDPPRAVAEPSLARFATQTLKGFNNARVNVSLKVTETGKSTSLRYSLSDLDMSPIDLVHGGESEVVARARNAALQAWIDDGAVIAALGSIESLSVAEVLPRTEIEVQLDKGTPSVTKLLLAASSLRKAVQNGRAVQPGDLNAAASPNYALTEGKAKDLAIFARDALASRASAMLAQLSSLTVSLSDARRALGEALDRLAQALAEPEGLNISARKAEAEMRRKALLPQLRAAACWSEPGALRPFTLIEGLADRMGLDHSLRQLEERLKGRITKLSAALAEASGTTAALAEVRAQLTALESALRQVLDGDGFVVLPPVPIQAETTPLLEAPLAPAGSPVLQQWSPVREKVALALELAALTPTARAYAVHGDATREVEPGGDTDAGAALVPRSLHFGVFLSDRKPGTLASAAGFVIDEWADQMPSDRQTGGLAVNYDSPQAEAPNCVLLCVPPSTVSEDWNGEAAAKMVREAIAWMRVRALSTADKPAPGALLPNGNQVAAKPPAQGGRQRIPKQQSRFAVHDWLLDGSYIVRGNRGSGSADLNERTRFGRAED